MRAAAVLALLAAACGGRDRDGEAGPRGAAPRSEPEERCDPARPRVCVGPDVFECDASGFLGRRLRSCRDGCELGACAKSCGAGNVELIYVVDDANRLLSFDPRKLPGDPFELIGALRCSDVGSPFSMAVDREGTAWVLYSDGELYRVSVSDARCARTGYAAGSSGSHTFGMGFVTEAAGGQTERLYIAANDATHGLGYIDTAPSTPRAYRLGTIEANAGQNPELTGTGEGKLFGFFPTPDRAFVQEIDRQTGAARGPRWTIDSPLGHVGAYAFAHWGGTFYIFTASFSTAGLVTAVDRATGTSRTVRTDVPYRITGAGVSTCAPDLDR